METTITIRTGKGKRSTKKELDKTVVEVVNIAEKIKGEWVECKRYKDGSSITILS